MILTRIGVRAFNTRFFNKKTSSTVNINQTKLAYDGQSGDCGCGGCGCGGGGN